MPVFPPSSIAKTRSTRPSGSWTRRFVTDAALRPIFLVGILDAGDVSLGDRLVVDGVRLRLNLDLKLVFLDVPISLEGDAVDDLVAAGKAHHDPAVDDLGVNGGVPTGRLEVIDAALHRSRVGPREKRLQGLRVDLRALYDDLLGESGRGGREGADAKHKREDQSAEENRGYSAYGSWSLYARRRYASPGSARYRLDACLANRSSRASGRRDCCARLSGKRTRLTAFYNFEPLPQPFIGQDYTIS